MKPIFEKSDELLKKLNVLLEDATNETTKHMIELAIIDAKDIKKDLNKLEAQDIERQQEIMRIAKSISSKDESFDNYLKGLRYGYDIICTDERDFPDNCCDELMKRNVKDMNEIIASFNEIIADLEELAPMFKCENEEQGGETE